MSRRIGRFFISRPAVDDNLAKLVYQKVVPLRVDTRYDIDAFEVCGLCDEFDPISGGTPAPWYKIEWQFGEAQPHSGGSILPTIGVKFLPAANEGEASVFW